MTRPSPGFDRTIAPLLKQQNETLASLQSGSSESLGGATWTEVFTATGAGSSRDFTEMPMGRYALQVSEVGGTATSWTVRLEISLDGVGWTLGTEHTRTTHGNTVTIFFTGKVARYARVNCVGVVLGAATNVTAVALAMP